MGSLFKLRDLWATKCGEEEEFDKKCIAISNVDNEPSNAEIIVLGSFSGAAVFLFLRYATMIVLTLLPKKLLSQPSRCFSWGWSVW